LGWFPENLDESIEAVILGMHAKADNPELLKARELDLKIYSYPEFLYEHAKNKTRVVIGGSHGKTTITSMILHVLKYHQVAVDYMVGAQLEGFDNMVHLTETNEFIVLEGDEYLSSPIDLRPKFHLYKPNIALISGISWDHINVFPTFENYVEQFRGFVDSMTPGGILVYNQLDTEVCKVVEEQERPIKLYSYTTPESFINNGKTYLQTTNGEVPLEIFGKHNLQNLAGAKWICQHMGINEDEFYDAISTFQGASKRLEQVAINDTTVVFKDFAHAPSKVKATVEAVKYQFSDRPLLAVLELHTYSSLNSQFMNEYKGSLDKADEAVVFYSPHTVAIKRLENVSKTQIREAFGLQELKVYTKPDDFKEFLLNQPFKNQTVLLMSSGNYGGLDFDALGKRVSEGA
jgi:UDP-N-acetylmuramate: L-alanyl-gamma-D-glutamyl-meso-diaminopimelate ligase